MPSSNVSWGIEIGSGAIKAVKLERTGDGVSLADFVVLPHIKVLSTPGLDQNDAMRVALGQLVNQVDLSGATVAVSVPGHAAFARFAKLPPVEPKKVPDIVKFEAVQQIPFPIDQVEWDYQTFTSPDTPDVEVGIFAITRERVMERLVMYQDVDLTPDIITLSPVAVYNAMAYDLAFTEKTPGTILLDVGTTSTDLIVAEAGRVWVRTFPVGGHHFTEALVNAFKLTYPKAEKLKKEADSSKHARHIFQALRPVFSDLAQEVQRSIGYYQSLHRDAQIVRLIGMGSTFRLPGIRKFLKAQLQMDVYRLESFKRLTPDGPRAGEFQGAVPTLATAYGLALQGVGLQSINANLMPVSVVRSALWKRKVKWFAVAAGIAAAASGAMFLRPFMDSQAVASEPREPIIDEVIREAAQLKAQAADVTSEPVQDHLPANLIELAQSRGVYQHLVNDLGLMFESAQARAADWAAENNVPPAPEGPAFTLRAFRTRYGSSPETLASAAGGVDAGGAANEPENYYNEAAAARAARLQDPNYRGEGFESGAASGDAGAAAAAGEGMPEGQRITVTMEVTTAQPNAQKFVLATLDRWLRENQSRPGVPYRIVLPSGRPVWEQVRVEQIAAPVAAATPGSPVPPAAEPGGRRVTSRRQSNEHGGGFVDEFGNVYESVGGGESQSDPAQAEANQSRGVAQANIERLAPLPPPPPEAPPGTTLTTFRLTWWAVVVPPGQEGAAGSEPGTAGETGGAR